MVRPSIFQQVGILTEEIVMFGVKLTRAVIVLLTMTMSISLFFDTRMGEGLANVLSAIAWIALFIGSVKAKAVSSFKSVKELKTDTGLVERMMPGWAYTLWIAAVPLPMIWHGIMFSGIAFLLGISALAVADKMVDRLTALERRRQYCADEEKP